MDNIKNKPEKRSVRSVKVAPHQDSMEPPEEKCTNMCSFPAVLFHVLTLFLAALAFGLLCGGLGSQYWAKDTGLNLGLFEACSNGQCGSASSVLSGVDYLDAVAGLDIVGLLLFVASLLVLCLHIATDACYSVAMALSLGLLSAGILLAFAAGIFICAGSMHFLYSIPSSYSLAASWWLATFAGIITLFYWIPLFVNFILSPSDDDNKKKEGIEETAADKPAAKKEKKPGKKERTAGPSNGQAYTLSKSPTVQSNSTTTVSIATSSNVLVESTELTSSKEGNNVPPSNEKAKFQLGEKIISVVPVGEDGAVIASSGGDSKDDANKGKEDSDAEKGTKKRGSKKGSKTPRTQEPLPPLHVPNAGPVTEQMQANAMRRIESDPQMSSRDKKKKDKSKEKHRSKSKEESSSDKKKRRKDKEGDSKDSEGAAKEKKSKHKSDSKEKDGETAEKSDKKEKSERRHKKEKAEGGDKKEKSEKSSKKERGEEGSKKEKGGEKRERSPEKSSKRDKAEGGSKKEKGGEKRDKSHEKRSKKDKAEGGEKRERSPEKKSKKEKTSEEDGKKESKKKHTSKSKERSSDAGKGEKEKKSKEKDGSKKKHRKE